MFTNTDRTIDSRDIIERIEALENERESLLYENGGGMSQDEFDNSDEGKELETLKELEEECKQYSADWEYGVTLIHEDYFTEYTEELCKEIGDISQELPEYIADHIDWEGVAEDLKSDYTEYTLDGHTYFCR